MPIVSPNLVFFPPCDFLSISPSNVIILPLNQNLSAVDPDHPQRGSEVWSAWIEDLGALVTAGAPSGTGLHHHHPKVGSTAQVPMREAHKREAVHPQGTVGRTMDQNTARAQRQGAWALGTGAQLKKMDTVAALAPSLGMIGALLMMTITTVLPGAVNLLKNGCTVTAARRELELFLQGVLLRPMVCFDP